MYILHTCIILQEKITMCIGRKIILFLSLELRKNKINASKKKKKNLPIIIYYYNLIKPTLFYENKQTV